jgi:hypothetical protein
MKDYKETTVKTLKRSQSAIGKLMLRLETARSHIDYLHRIVAELYSPIGNEEAMGTELCRFVGMRAFAVQGSVKWRCNHRVDHDGLCGSHWNMIFAHEWNFTGSTRGQRKFNKDMPFPAKCSLCGASRSAATMEEKCPLKGEKKWVEKELADFRSRL